MLPEIPYLNQNPKKKIAIKSIEFHLVSICNIVGWRNSFKLPHNIDKGFFVGEEGSTRTLPIIYSMQYNYYVKLNKCSYVKGYLFASLMTVSSVHSCLLSTDTLKSFPYPG